MRANRDVEQRKAQRELVRAGYDAISMAYRDDRGSANPSSAENTAAYESWLDELTALLPDGAPVLDLGCGTGVPASRILVDRGFNVTGLDISGVQIGRARLLVPQANFVEADMATWDCEPGSYQAIVSLYALIHVPVDDQRRLFPRMVRWLRPRGYLLAIVGHKRWTGIEHYMGAPMFWDHADTQTYLAWLREAGMRVLSNRVIPEGALNHTLVLAQTKSLSCRARRSCSVGRSVDSASPPHSQRAAYRPLGVAGRIDRRPSRFRRAAARVDM